MEEVNDVLKASLEKKIRTIMIGALDSFEKMFGDLWGHGLSVDELDDEERRCREEWNEVRKQILDHGNTNIRNMASELNKYSVHRRRFIYDFKIGKGHKNER